MNQAPVAQENISAMVDETASVGTQIATFTWTDPDDTAHLLTLSGNNPDLDGDGTPAFEVVSGPTAFEGVLQIADPDDVDFGVAGQQTALTIDINDQDPTNPLSDTLIVKINTTSRFTESTSIGDVLINEVLWADHELHQPSFEKDEFVEIVNTSGAPMTITGWRLSDVEDAATPGEADSFSFTFPPTTLAPSEHVVVWTGPPGGTRSTPAGTRDFWANSTGADLAKTDDVWLFDDSGAIVAYVAWGNDGTADAANLDVDEITDRPPIDAWNLWDPTHESSLGTGAIQVGQSIALTPSGDTDAARLSACWEWSTSGIANPRCPRGPWPTTDTDSVAVYRTASPGVNNNLTLVSNGAALGAGAIGPSVATALPWTVQSIVGVRGALIVQQHNDALRRDSRPR